MNSIWIAFGLAFVRIHLTSGSSDVTFVCKSGHILSGFHYVCDGRIDCYDGSDESAELCSRSICPIEHFKCHYGACVHRHKKCDGRIDCVDASDERNCGRKLNSCPDNEFFCANNKEGAPTQHCISAQLLCDGRSDCYDGSDESPYICSNHLCPLETFRCGYGECIPVAAQCDGFRDCYDGSDESSELCLTLKCPECGEAIECPPLVQQQNIISARIDFQCQWDNRPISCTQRILPGTKMFYSCKEYYEPVNEMHANNDRNICQADGTWLRDMLECTPTCGRMSEIIPLIVNGWQSVNTLPWHASLYAVADDDGDDPVPKFSCSATLISEVVLITAAHCTWNVKPSNIRIALGSSRIQFNDSDSSFIRRYAVNQVVMHPLYLDRHGNYGSDIALIEIVGFVRFSELLSPVCVDWNLDDITSHLSDQSVGLVVGLGLNENLVYSDSLKVATMPVVENRKCTESHSNDFRKYITFTTFCAGWANGTGVCNGDSGAGLIFPMVKRLDRWCLQGIVSLSPRRISTAFCDPHQYSIFTKVGIYVKWIRQVLDDIHEQHAYNLTYEYDEEPVW